MSHNIAPLSSALPPQSLHMNQRLPSIQNPFVQQNGAASSQSSPAINIPRPESESQQSEQPSVPLFRRRMDLLSRRRSALQSPPPRAYPSQLQISQPIPIRPNRLPRPGTPRFLGPQKSEPQAQEESYSSNAPAIQSSPIKPFVPEEFLQGVQETIELQKQKKHDLFIDELTTLFEELAKGNELEALLKALLNGDNSCSESVITFNNFDDDLESDRQILQDSVNSSALPAEVFSFKLKTPITAQIQMANIKNIISKLSDKLPSIETWKLYCTALKGVDTFRKITLAKPLLSFFSGIHCEKGQNGSETLNKFLKVSKEDREALILRLQNAVNSFDDDQKRACLIQTYNYFDVYDNEKALPFILQILRSLPTFEAIQTCTALRFVERTKLISFFNMTSCLFEKNFAFCSQNKIFEKLVALFPVYKDVMDGIVAILIYINFSAMSNFRIARFLKNLENLQDPNRYISAYNNISSSTISLIKTMMPTLKNLKYWQQKKFIDVITLIPYQSQENINKIYHFLSLYENENDPLLPGGTPWNDSGQMSFSLKMFPEDIRMQVITNWTSLKESNTKCTISPIAIILNLNPEIKLLCFTHLIKYFEETYDQNLALNYAVFILDWIYDLNSSTPEDDAFVSLIETIRVQADIKVSNKVEHLGNPYFIYSMLSRKTELVKLNSPLVLATINDKKIIQNLEGFQACATEIKYTMADLPPGIKPDAIEVLFNELETRLSTLDEQKKMACEQEIYRHFPDKKIQDLQILKGRLLGFGKQIPKFLNVHGNPDSEIDEGSYYLYLILDHIFKKSNEPSQPEKLSPREAEFILFCTYVYECNIGQIDGIKDFYVDKVGSNISHNVKLAYEHSKQIEMYVDQEFQGMLWKVLANEELHVAIKNFVIEDYCYSDNDTDEENEEFAANDLDGQQELPNRSEFLPLPGGSDERIEDTDDESDHGDVLIQEEINGQQSPAQNIVQEYESDYHVEDSESEEPDNTSPVSTGHVSLDEQKEEECKSPEAEHNDIIRSQNVAWALNDKQIAHIKISLANHFHKEIGLKHKLVFDLVAALNDKYYHALHHYPKMVLALIVARINIELLIKHAKISVKNCIKNGIGYSPFDHYFNENFLNVPATDFTIHDLVELDKDNNMIGVTELGALTILKSRGYIKIE